MVKQSTQIQINNDRLLDSFMELAKINAPSGHEKPMAEFLIPILEQLGFSYTFDEAHKEFGGNCGNLIAYWEGTHPSVEPMFLSTHMDTVLPTEGLKPEIRDGIIHSDGTTILGADDRAALAAYLEGIRYIQENDIPCGPIELVLTVNEQPGLVGASYMDYSKVKSKKGFVFDSSGDIGQIILQGPYSSRIYCDIQGRSSHIGLNPEEGINAFLIAADALKNMKLGKISEITLANIGQMNGGKMSSIIPGEVKLVGEVRSFEAKGLNEQLEHMKQSVEEAAKQHGGKADIRYEKKYLGWKIDEKSPLGQTALQAADEIDVNKYTTQTLGGADTNVLNENGLECITLGNGFRNIHTFQEHISVENLMNGGRYAASLIKKWYELHK
ncbi:M20/M25/M40 family metallo-hydrolase [Virgibacillus halodenitrificans]|uniref:M20/M25/M40 family metallo-hydrolase n=1 Tax=Virgibacillus halodenitrificans TaxID=1482 RepID=UPI00136E2DA0|nr:M20/M25/M40 family metallo-hydrolase [Virgibacillus halodenitrificans]MYL45190.1 M20/M25/M40 family metallo-hydrolase [Virgibacillus halodenitrificans]